LGIGERERVLINKDILLNLNDISALYKESLPFPHIIIDNFLSPDILEIVLREIKEYQHWSFHEIPEIQINKYFTPSTENEEETAKSLKILKQKAPVTHATLEYLYSEDILEFLENLTGTKNLEEDPSWFGAGVHKIEPGGALAIHSDFNLNWEINKYRRINLLLYLNKDWKDEYNGHLEFWEKDMSSCAGKIAPIFNRAVIFSTNKTSYHGHPAPLIGTTRYSLAVYYYSKFPPEDDKKQRFVTWTGNVL
jgi:Rps23 Pro-64 3,4-dihydroxylase Tpa1-like proline 4-hydroxylase